MRNLKKSPVAAFEAALKQHTARTASTDSRIWVEVAQLHENLPSNEFSEVLRALKEGWLEWRSGSKLWVTPKGELEAMDMTEQGHYPPWLSVADNETDVAVADFT